MISNQVIQTSIDELKTITKIDLCVIDMEGITVATTFDNRNVSQELVKNFVSSPADSQIVGGYHMLKVLEDGDVLYVLIARGEGADAYMIGKVAVSQIQNLVIAYRSTLTRTISFRICCLTICCLSISITVPRNSTSHRKCRAWCI